LLPTSSSGQNHSRCSTCWSPDSEQSKVRNVSLNSHMTRDMLWNSTQLNQTKLN
jgi:hypothetical protein